MIQEDYFILNELIKNYFHIYFILNLNNLTQLIDTGAINFIWVFVNNIVDHFYVITYAQFFFSPFKFTECNTR